MWQVTRLADPRIGRALRRLDWAVRDSRAGVLATAPRGHRGRRRRNVGPQPVPQRASAVMTASPIHRDWAMPFHRLYAAVGHLLSFSSRSEPRPRLRTNSGRSSPTPSGSHRTDGPNLIQHEQRHPQPSRRAHPRQHPTIWRSQPRSTIAASSGSCFLRAAGTSGRELMDSVMYVQRSICSTRCDPTSCIVAAQRRYKNEFCAPGETRTPNLLIRSWDVPLLMAGIQQAFYWAP